jgi:hypothetical protein
MEKKTEWESQNTAFPSFPPPTVDTMTLLPLHYINVSLLLSNAFLRPLSVLPPLLVLLCDCGYYYICLRFLPNW